MRNPFSLVLVVSVLSAALPACNMARSAPTPDTQATVNAAVAATSTA